MRQVSEQEIEYKRLALAMVGIASDEATCETLILIDDEVKRLGGDFSVREAAEIKYFIKRKYAPKQTETTTTKP